MKKQTVVILIILPLIIVLILASAIGIISVAADIPVSGIRLLNIPESGILSVDLAKSSEFVMEVEVLPERAKNKKFTVLTENLSGNCGVSVKGESLEFNCVGQTKITVKTNDGGYQAGFIAVVTSSKALDFIPSIYDGNGEKVPLKSSSFSYYGYEAALEGGEYVFAADVFPSDFSGNGILWTCEDEEMLYVNSVTGRARAKLSGCTTVTAQLDDGAGGRIRKSIKVDIAVSADKSGLSVEGGAEEIKAARNAEEISFAVNKNAAGELYVAPSSDFEILEISPCAHSSEGFTVTIRPLSDKYGFKIVMGVKGSGKPEKIVEVGLYEYEFDISTAYHDKSYENIYQLTGSETGFIPLENCALKGVEYVWEISDAAGQEVLEDNGARCVVRAKKEGGYFLTAKAYLNGKEIFSRTQKVVTVTKPDAYVFAANIQDNGIGGVFVVGGYGIKDGEYEKVRVNFSLTEVITGRHKSCGVNDFAVTAFGAASAEVGDGGVSVQVLKDGEARIVAEWKYGEYFKSPVRAETTIICKAAAVNAYDYEDLKRAAEDGRAVALMKDVKLGYENMSLADMKRLSKSVPTTYDYTYYSNKKLSRPDVYALLEFKNDVYGNGHELNAEYFTTAKDSKGYPLFFKSPLDFVSMGSAAVKGQDNICFLARTDGITIDNISLKGCSEESFTQNGMLNLKKLDSAGTVLEIAANTKLTNSRVSNGRTAVRIFGGGGKGADGEFNPVVGDVSEVNAEKERVCATIEKCVLSRAREFVLKIGSNRALSAEGEDKASFRALPLVAADGTPYSPTESHLEDDYFKKNYVTTDVTLSDSVLSDSGLFSIGMDAHFAGEMLNGYHILAPAYWHNLAATSFASVLRIKGDVRIYDWKKLSNVDSSTLIDTTNGADAYLKLDIPAMIEKVYKTGGEAYKNIFASIDGEKYVHGGIACFGGGYNYCTVDFTDFIGEELNSYFINLSVLSKGESKFSLLYLQGTLLPAAAGKEDFRFYIYDAASVNGYYKQQRELSDGSAYSAVFGSH